MATYLVMLADGKFARLVKGGSWAQECNEWEPVRDINEADVMAGHLWDRWMRKYGKIPGVRLAAKVTRKVEIVTHDSN